MTVVLIADDEASLRLLVRATIASDQYEVVEATDGLEAWRVVQERRPQLVLLDVQMPGQTGLEVCRLIRAHPTLSDTRVVLLTAKTRDADVEDGQMAGADQYLTKPFSPIELLEAVERLLGSA